MIVNWLSDVRDWIRAAVMAAARWIVWSPWRVAAAVAVIILGLVVVVQVRASHTGPHQPQASQATVSPSQRWPEATAKPHTKTSVNAGPRETATPTRTADSPSPGGESSPEGKPSPGATDTGAAASLSGDKLGHAWITGFLTRDKPSHSRQWKDQIENITTSKLIDSLEAEGTDKLALDLSGPWQVTNIARYRPPDPVASTPTRVQLPYIVTVSNGDTSTKKPFILTAYKGEDGWKVANATQPYTSHG